MSTLAADTTRFFESNHDDMLNEVPIIASDTVYAGAAVGESSSTGTYRALVALDNFAGFATQKADNSAGAASAISVRVKMHGVVRIAVTGVTSTANIGDDVYASDDGTLTLTATGNSWVGKVIRWDISTTCYVRFQATVLAPAASDAVLNSITSGDAALTVTGKTGATASAGGTVDLVGGTGGTTSGTGGAATATGGTGTGTGTGGAVTLTGGTSGTGATGNGGAANLVGGAAASVNGTGGAAVITGGLGTGTGAGGAITVTSGAAGATGVAGAINIAVGAATAGNGSALTLTGGNGAGSTNSGGNVNIIPGAAVSTGTPGEFQINSSTAGCIPVSFNYTSALVTQSVFTASRAFRVKSIIGRVRVAGSGGACTIQFFKAPSATAIGSGTALDNSSTFNIAGSADTNQTITLSSTVATVTLAAGDSIGYVLTGTATSAVGSVTITLVPC
jgi:hypothetical protein